MKYEKDIQLAACIFCDHWDDENERMKNRLYCKANCKYRQSYEEFKARQYNELMFGDFSFGNEWMCSDYIKREDAENKLAKIITGDVFKEIKEDTKKSVAKDFFSDIPAADVVEVIRCKDCLHNHTKSWNQGKRDKPSCHFTDLTRSNEFYCGFGERVNT